MKQLKTRFLEIVSLQQFNGKRCKQVLLVALSLSPEKAEYRMHCSEQQTKTAAFFRVTFQRKTTFHSTEQKNRIPGVLLLQNFSSDPVIEIFHFECVAH